MAEYQFCERAGEPRIAYRIDTPSGTPRGRVLMVHGYAEHSARYDKVAALFCEHGLAVARYDQRGHGRSEGDRGHVVQFDDYVRDVYALLRLLEHDSRFQGGRAPMLFGHSLGGLVATHSAISLGGLLSGLALTSPFYGLAMTVPKVQVVAGTIVAKVAPKLKQPSNLKGSDLTHDAALAATYDHDPFHFGHVTVGWFTQISRAQQLLAERARQLTTPVFCIAAGDDRVVSVDTIRRIFPTFSSADKELDVRPGLFHEVLNELDWRDHATRLAERMVRWSG